MVIYMLFLLKIIILALIQGIGEILPISSSGHLIMISNILSLNQEDVTLEIFLHLASLLALTIYYFTNIKNMFIGVIKYLFKHDKRYYIEWAYFTTIIIATIPCALIGYIVNDYLIYLTSYVGILLIINGIVLLLFKDKHYHKNIEDLTIIDKVRFGLYQSFGLFPGISRSGIVLSCAKRNKLNKEDSFNLTFYMLFPLVIGSLILNITDFRLDKNLILPYIISFLITFILTYFSMIIFHNLIAKNKSKIFGYYCLFIGMCYSLYVILS